MGETIFDNVYCMFLRLSRRSMFCVCFNRNCVFTYYFSSKIWGMNHTFWPMLTLKNESHTANFLYCGIFFVLSTCVFTQCNIYVFVRFLFQGNQGKTREDHFLTTLAHVACIILHVMHVLASFARSTFSCVFRTI